MSTTQTVTLTQLAQHNTKSDLWIAVHGKVYQLASFAPDHPGGIDVLLECGGTDGTETYDYAGHSEGAKVTLERFFVGHLEGHNSDPTLTSNGAASRSVQRTEETTTPSIGLLGSLKIKSVSKPLIWTIGLACVGALAAQVLSTMFQSETPGATASTSSQSVVASWLTSFWGGIMLASLVAGAGFVYLYGQFSKTLEHSNDPFSYPAIISRPVYVK